MIITDPALAIIQDTFGFGSTALAKPARSRRKSTAPAFTSQAYAEAGILPNRERGLLAASAPAALDARRKQPVR